MGSIALTIREILASGRERLTTKNGVYPQKYLEYEGH